MSPLEALERIASDAPAKEPSDGPRVGWPLGWSTDYRDEVNDMLREAYDAGYVRALWEMGKIADTALEGAA